MDTDTIVNLPLLYHQLTHDDNYKNIENLLMGSCYCCGNYPTHCGRVKTTEKKYWYRYYQLNKPRNVVDHTKYQSQRRASQESTKWLIPDYMYNGDKYPSYIAGGSGYVLSRKSAKCIFEMALQNVPYLLGRVEDVYITGFLAQACQIHRMNHPGFNSIGNTDFNAQHDVSIHRPSSYELDLSNISFTAINETL